MMMDENVLGAGQAAEVAPGRSARSNDSTPRRTALRWRGPGAVLALIAGLYISQGLSYGFFSRTFPVLLRQEGTAIEIVGLSHLLFLPWVLSVFWSPLVDRYHFSGFGRRKSWLVPTQSLLAICMMLIALWLSARAADLTSNWLVPVFLVLGASSLAATQDIATDGYAVEMLSVEARGFGNSWQVGGYWIGVLASSGGLMFLQARVGLVAGMSVLCGFIAIVCLGVALKREVDQPWTPEQGTASLLKTLRRADIRLMLVVIILYRFGDAFASAMIAPYLVDRGLGMAEIGGLVGTAGVGFALAGCLVGGVLVRPLGRRRALLVFGAVQVASCAAYAAMVLLNIKSFVALTAIIGLGYFAVSAAYVALYTIMMDFCSVEQASTDFTVQSCIVNLAGITASSVSGFGAASLGYGGHFVLAFVLTSLGLVGVTLLLPRLARRRDVCGGPPCGA